MNYEELIKRFKEATAPYADVDNLVKGYVVPNSDQPGSVIIMVATTNEPGENLHTEQAYDILDSCEAIDEISDVEVFGSIEDLDAVVSKIAGAVPMSYLEE